MLDEKDFQRRADAAFEDLKRRMLTAGDEHGFDVEGEAGKLEVLFEEPEEAKFVVSPNTPVREIWVSALSTSFKLGWNESRNAFIHEKTGEDLRAVMSRVISHDSEKRFAREAADEQALSPRSKPPSLHFSSHHDDVDQGD